MCCPHFYSPVVENPNFNSEFTVTAFLDFISSLYPFSEVWAEEMPRAVCHSRVGRCCMVSQLPLVCCRVQELMSDDQREAGRIPRTIECELVQDLVDSCVPGDMVTVTGIVKVSSTEEGEGQHLGLLFPGVGCFGRAYTRITTVAPLHWSSQCCKCIKCKFLQKLPNFYSEELFYGIICSMVSL